MLSVCPFCHNSEGGIYNKDDKAANGGSASIYKCNKCEVLYPSFRMDTKEFSEHLCRLSTNQGNFKFDDPAIPINRQDSLVELLKKYTQCLGNALDVGTFDGRFCFILASLGFRAYGVEPQKNAAQFARDCGLDVFTGSFPGSLPEELLRIKFDLVSFMESIYYFEDLKKSLFTAHNLLNKKGLLLIKAHQAGSRYYNDKSLFSRYGDQVQWFPTYDSMKYILRESGFKIIKTIGINPAELLPLGMWRIRNVFLSNIVNSVYNRAMLDYTLLDIRKADRLIMLAQKI